MIFVFFIEAQEKYRRICNIELIYASVSFRDGSVALCICDNAELFSRDVLKQLLLTDDGSAAALSAALSLDSGGLKIQAVSLK